MIVNGEKIREYYGKPYVELNDNEPNFPESERKERFFEEYNEFFSFKKCNKEYIIYAAYACIEKNHMPTEKRKGNRNKKVPKCYAAEYDFIKGKQLYNNCHLIGYQLSGNESDKRNLIIGTRYMNEKGMSPFENEVANYVQNTGNHVLYRVTPVFDEKNQLAKGVQMEAFSVEDKGEGICFNVFVYNVQPGVIINYEDGSSKADDEWCSKIFTRNNIYTDKEKGTQDYILNMNTNIFHKPGCKRVSNIKLDHKLSFNWPRQFLIDNGCKMCGNCKP